MRSVPPQTSFSPEEPGRYRYRGFSSIPQVLLHSNQMWAKLKRLLKSLGPPLISLVANQRDRDPVRRHADLTVKGRQSRTGPPLFKPLLSPAGCLSYKPNDLRREGPRAKDFSDTQSGQDLPVRFGDDTAGNQQNIIHAIIF